MHSNSGSNLTEYNYANLTLSLEALLRQGVKAVRKITVELNDQQLQTTLSKNTRPENSTNREKQ